MVTHIHKYKFDSKAERGHTHKILGYAGGMVGINSIHFHFFHGVSSYNDHTHYFSGITGMPIKTENGHIHKMDGVLENNRLHEHFYNGYTFEEISYISGRLYKRYELRIENGLK